MIKIKSKKEFDRSYHEMRDWPLETMYTVYKDMMEEINEEFDRLEEDRVADRHEYDMYDRG